MVYPFPNALNTGVPGYPNASNTANAAAAAALPAYSGPNPITVDGTVVNGYSFTGTLTVNAKNCVIENCYWNYDGTCINFGNPFQVLGTIAGTALNITYSLFGTPVAGQIIDIGSAAGAGYATNVKVASGGGTNWTLDTNLGAPPFFTTATLPVWGTNGNGIPSGDAGGIAIGWYGFNTVKNCEIFSGNPVNSGSQGINAAYCTITGCNIHGFAKAINFDGSNVTVGGGPGLGNYLWGMANGAHAENINANGSGSNYLVSYNTMVNALDQTTSIFFSLNFGFVDGLTFNNNTCGGADYGVEANDYSATVSVNNGSLPNGIAVSAANITAENNNIFNGALIGGFGYWVSPGNPDVNVNNLDFFTGNPINLPANTASAPNTFPVIQSFTSSNLSTTFEPCFTPDSTTFMQYVTTSLTFTLKGCTAAGDTVAIYQDGAASPLGTTTANASTGIWTYTVTATAGVHYYVAKDTTLNLSSSPMYVKVQA